MHFEALRSRDDKHAIAACVGTVSTLSVPRSNPKQLSRLVHWCLI